MNNNYNIGFINSYDSSVVDKLYLIFLLYNISNNRDNIAKDLRNNFRDYYASNIVCNNKIGALQGHMLLSIESASTAQFSKKEIISTQYSSSSNCITTSDGSYTLTGDGIYYKEPNAESPIHIYNSCMMYWYYLGTDSNEWVYFGAGTTTPKDSRGIVAVKKTDVHVLATSYYCRSTNNENSTYNFNYNGVIYSGSNNASDKSFLCLHSLHNVPTIKKLLDYTTIGPYYVSDLNDVYVYTSNATYLITSDSTIKLLQGTIDAINSSSLIRIITDSFGYTYVFGGNGSNVKGLKILSPDKQLIENDAITGLEPNSNICYVFKDPEDYIYISCGDSTVSMYNGNVIGAYEGKYTASNINNNALYLYGTILAKASNGTITTIDPPDTTAVYGDVYNAPTHFYILSSNKALWCIQDDTCTKVFSASSSNTIYKPFMDIYNNLYFQRSNLFYDEGLYICTTSEPNNATRVISYYNNWYPLITKTTTFIYNSSLSGGLNSSGSMFSGLYKVNPDGAVVRVFEDGYGWQHHYEKNPNEIYISNGDTNTAGILYYNGTNVKRIWGKSTSFKYVQETPNGLLVADTEFIGPDDKILYIKGDRVMETSINEINAYNKEANNE